MKGNLIGKGNTAEVYEWNDKEVLKLFIKEFPLQAIEKEYRISTIINGQGLPAPKAMQLIEIEGRNGIIYEKVTGPSMLDLINSNPYDAVDIAKQLAKLHYQMHQCRGTGLPTYQSNLEWNIKHTDLLSEAQKEAVLGLLSQLPEGDALCHGDFHPGNVIGEVNHYYILDWMTAAVGVPSTDVARTILLLRDSALPDSIPEEVKQQINHFRVVMSDAYLSEYIELSGMQLEEIKSWRIVLAAARLMECVPESEKNALLKEIVKAIGE